MTQENAELIDGRRPLPAGLEAFAPRRGLTNGHLQTIVGNYLPRPAFLVPASEDTVEVDPSNGSRVVCHCHWQPDPGMARRLIVVPGHGLEGSRSEEHTSELQSL